MIKYRVSFGRIDAIEVIRETDRTVLLAGSGRREAKRCDWQTWHDSWDDAKACLIADAERAVDEARMRLERAKNRLDRLRGMREA